MSKKRKTQPITQLLLQSLLPDDIFFGILERLPANSLLRFTSVSKSWKASIKNASFISSNHHHLRKNRSGTQLVFITHPCGYTSCSLVPQYSTIRPTIDYNPVLKFRERAAVVGSSEGLICFKTTYISDIYIWNPIIRTSLKKVRAGKTPVHTFPEVRRGKILSVALGFGFAPKSRDHRIVKLLCYDNYLSEVEIYSLASDSWRRMEPSYENRKKVRFLFLNNFAIYLDGSIYWLASLSHGDGRCKDIMILRFDLEEEKFEEIAVPPGSAEGYTLAVIKGFLVLWRVRPNSNEINVRAYIYQKSNSESSSWAAIATSVPSRYGETIISWNETTKGGQIIVGKGEHKSVLVYNTDCDGKNLSFESMDIRINDTKTRYHDIVPITPTLFLFDEKKDRDISRTTEVN